MMEHAAIVDRLLDADDATHVAIRNGDWTDPNTWKGGKVPDREADVYIPKGVTVTYDSNSKVPLGTVRVDGTLDWATNQNTTMLVETIVSSMGSQIEIGSMHNDAIGANVTANIIFRDTRLTDSDKLDHGLVAMGHVDIMGAKKESNLTIKGGAQAGDRTITVEGDTTNWKVGDTLLFVGTEYEGWNRDKVLQTQDEERVITAINGNKITFDKALSYDHEAPAGYDLDVYVSNLSRNVVFSSENPEGTRGHVMLMNGMVDHGEFANSAMFAEFRDLGRTDFTQDIDSGNPLGRYSLHLHQTGTGADASYSMIQGVSVNGGNGWGIVQHDSNAMIMDSVVYDLVGAGIVSETGAEQGMWSGNLVSKVVGYDADDRMQQDGLAYENNSRVIVQQDNIAANSKVGWNFVSREIFDLGLNTDGMHRKMFERDELKFDPSPFDEAIDHQEPAINEFNGNTVIGALEGVRIFHRVFSHDTEHFSVFKDFTAWEIDRVALNMMNYSSNYMLKDSLLIGNGKSAAVSTGWKTSAAVLSNVEVVDFGTVMGVDGIAHESMLIDVKLVNTAPASGTGLSGLSSEYNEWLKPKVVSSSGVSPVDAITFRAARDADLTLTPTSEFLDIRGTLTDSIGTRTFNEYIEPPTGKHIIGIQTRLNGGGEHRQDFTIDEFLEIHGTIQRADGSWYAPVVNWVTDRLTGDHHPVVIEIELEKFDQSYLKSYEMKNWKAPEINNTGYEYGFETLVSGGSSEPSEPSEPTTPTEPEEPGIIEGTSGNDKLYGTAADETIDGLAGDDEIYGEDGADVLYGSGGSDSIHGGEGNDTLYGNAGDDWLRGNAGDDTLEGGAGNDRLMSGNGSDSVSGGDGADIFVINGATSGTDDIEDFSLPEMDVIQLRNVLMSYDGKSDLTDHIRIVQSGNHGILQISESGKASDFAQLAWIRDGAGLDVSDMLSSGALVLRNPVDGSDGGVIEPEPTPEPTPDPTPEPGETPVATISGTSGQDSLNGTGKADVIDGKGSRDKIIASSGDDILIGGKGADLLYGGGGADKFYYGAGDIGTGTDDIKDFSLSEGDALDLSALIDLPDSAGLSKISNYIDVRTTKSKAYISVDLDGGGDDFVGFAMLRDQGDLTLKALVDADALLF